MRVVASLVRPDNSVAWAGEYEGAEDDVFGIQRRLAEGVSSALAITLTPLDRARLARTATSDAQALDLYSRGQALLERPDVAGNVPRAIDSFRAAIARDPGFALAHAGLGRAYWRQYTETHEAASAQKATAAVTEALRLDPDEPGTRLALATVYAGTGRGDAAIEELRKVIARVPSNDEAHRQLGDVMASRSRWEEAIAEMRKAVELRPKFADNVARLGNVLLASGRSAEAIEAFQRVAALQPDNPRAFQRLGTAYHVIGDEDRALENYRRALALGPDFKAYGNIGVLEYSRGRYAEAADAFGQAARLDPRDPGMQRNLGDAYLRLGRRGEAAQSYESAVRLCEDMLRVNPTDARVLGSIAVYEAKLGRRAAADQHVADALALSPADADVVYRKAVVSALAGRQEAALGALREAIARGYSATQARADDDLAGLRARPEFHAALSAPR
jgi:eukaryotic-like serine/threonine-protein kinase